MTEGISQTLFQEETQVAKVLMDELANLVFDYGIPADLTLQVGCRVKVPLRNRLANGTVIGIEPQRDYHHLKMIDRLVDPKPLISEKGLRLANWITDYYLCSLEQVISLFLPDSIRKATYRPVTTQFVSLVDFPPLQAWEKIQKRSPKQTEILRKLQRSEIALPFKSLGGSSVRPAAKRLEELGWVKIEEMIIQRRPQKERSFFA